MQSAEEQELAALCTRHNDANLDSEIYKKQYCHLLPVCTIQGKMIFPRTKLSSISADPAFLRKFLRTQGAILWELYDIPALTKFLKDFKVETPFLDRLSNADKILLDKLLSNASNYTFLGYIEEYMKCAANTRQLLWEANLHMITELPSRVKRIIPNKVIRDTIASLKMYFEEAKPHIKNQETYCKIFSFLCRDESKEINLVRLLLKYNNTDFTISLDPKDPKSLYAMCSLYDQYSDSKEGLEIIEQLLLSHLYNDSGKLFSQLTEEYQCKKEAALLSELSNLSIQKDKKSIILKRKSKSKNKSFKPANLKNKAVYADEQHSEDLKEKESILGEQEASSSKINVPFQNQTSIFKIHPRVKKWQWPIEKLEAYFQRPNNISDQKYSRQSGLELEQQKIVHDLYGAHKILEGPDHNDYFSYSPYGKYKQSKSASAYSSLIVYDTSGNEVLQNDRGFVDIGIEEKEDKSPLIYHLMFRKEQSEQKAAENILRSSSSAAYKSFQEEREGKVSKAEEQEDQVSEDEDTGFTPPKGGKYTISRDRNNDYIVDFFRDHKRHKSLHIYSCKPKRLFP